MTLVQRKRILYSSAEQSEFRQQIISILSNRYAADTRVKNIWLTGSITTGDFGVYNKPYTDRYGKVQKGSDIDVTMTIDYEGSIEEFRRDKSLHKSLWIRNKGNEDSYVFFDDSGKGIFLKGHHPKIDRIIKHPVYGVVFTTSYFRDLVAGKFDKETIEKGQGSWKGIEKKKNIIKII